MLNKELSVDFDRLNKWLTLAANIGVVGGIVFLAIEVRQNQASLEEFNKINRLDARTIEVQQYNDFRTVLAENKELSDIWAKGIIGETLDSSESERFDHLCKNILWIGVTAHERSIELGRVDTARGGITSTARQLNNSSGYRRCWEDNRDIIRGYGFVEYVDAIEAESAGL
jgi:hypothetical protein